MKEYYEEVVNIGSNIVDLIEENDEKEENVRGRIEIQSVFLSLEDIATICEYIAEDSYGFKDARIKELIAK